MKQVFHLVAKDLRHLRGWVFGWLATLTVPVVIGVLLLRDEPTPDQWNAYGVVLGAALGLQVVVAYLMTILLVQADRVVGTDAFWVTRPISGGRLLASKLVTAGLVFVGGAVLLYVPWWLFCGLGVREILVTAVELLPPAATVLVPAMLIGALTDSLGRALLWSMILAAVGLMVPAFFSVVLSSSSARFGSDLALFFVVGCGATLLAMGTAVAILYRTRRYTRWLAVPAVGLVVALLVGRFAPLVWRPADEPSEWRAERAAAVTVGFHDAYSGRGGINRSNLGIERWDNVWVGFTLQGTAPDLVVEGVGARHRWTWEGGAHVGRDGRLNVLGTSGGFPMLGLKGLPPDQETVDWWREQRRPGRLSSLGNPMTRPGEGFRVQANTLLPGSIAERLDRDPARYAGSLWLTLRRPTVLNEMPLQPGSWTIGGAQGMRVGGVESREHAVVIRAVDTTPFSWMETYRGWRQRGRWFGTWHDQGFVLLNRGRGEFVSLNDRPRTLVVAGVQLTWRELTASGLRVRRGDRWESWPGWMDDATIAFVRAVPESTFRRDVEVDAMRVRRGER